MKLKINLGLWLEMVVEGHFEIVDLDLTSASRN